MRSHIVQRLFQYCQSRVQNLKNAMEALLADIHVSASAAKGHSGKFTLEDETSFLGRILARLQEKVNKMVSIHVINLVVLYK